MGHIWFIWVHYKWLVLQWTTNYTEVSNFNISNCCDDIQCTSHHDHFLYLSRKWCLMEESVLHTNGSLGQWQQNWITAWPALCAYNINDLAASRLVQNSTMSWEKQPDLNCFGAVEHSVAQQCPSFQASFSQKVLIKPKVYVPLLSMLHILIGSRGQKSLPNLTIFTLIQCRNIAQRGGEWW
jgi:hypothetical protein